MAAELVFLDGDIRVVLCIAAVVVEVFVSLVGIRCGEGFELDGARVREVGKSCRSVFGMSFRSYGHDAI